jgi:hypothetical protein
MFLWNYISVLFIMNQNMFKDFVNILAIKIKLCMNMDGYLRHFFQVTHFVLF